MSKSATPPDEAASVDEEAATPPHKFCNVVKLTSALPVAEVPSPGLAEAVTAKLRELGVQCCVLNQLATDEVG